MNNDEIKKIIEKYIEALNCLIYDHSETGLKDDLKYATQLLSQPTQGDVTVEEFYKEFFGVSELFANGTTINKSVLRFAEAYATQYKPTQGEGVCTCKDGNIIKSDNGVYWCQTCGKYPVIMATQTPAELRAEFQHLKMKLNYACYDKDVLSKMGAVWEAMDKLEQKLTGKE